MRKLHKQITTFISAKYNIPPIKRLSSGTFLNQDFRIKGCA